MKDKLIGFVLGVLVSLSIAAHAVNYARDIQPMLDFKEEIELRVKALEALHDITVIGEE